MLQVARAIEVRDNFKKYCDAAINGDVIHVARTQNKDVVILSASEYNQLLEFKRVEEIEAAIRRAEEDRSAGRVFTSEEVREQMRITRNG